MQYLYIITNLVNNKKYVGKTAYSLRQRWNSHKSAAKREMHKPLYAAINKYGSDNFIIELVKECSDETIYDEEINLIKELNTYFEGYNASLGGEGLKLINLSDRTICKKYYEVGSADKCAVLLNISASTVLNTLSKYDLPKIGNNIAKPTKAVLIIELNKVFPSAEKCAEYLIKANISNAVVSSVKTSIQAVCSGNRKNYKKLTFSYV